MTRSDWWSGDVNLSFRPATYWPKSLTAEQLLSRVKGQARREIARKVLEEQGFSGLSTFLARQGPARPSCQDRHRRGPRGLPRSRGTSAQGRGGATPRPRLGRRAPA